MKRKDNQSVSGNIPFGDIANDLLVFPKHLFDVFLKDENPLDLIGLYSFYYYTAKWQKTNQIQATNGYCQKGLKISEPRLLRAKKVLLDLGLIEKIKKKSSISQGWFIKLNYIIKQSTVMKSKEPQIQGSSKNPKNPRIKELTHQGSNALSSGSINALSSDKKKSKPKKVSKITLDQFEKFWKVYPRKISKDAAIKSWMELSTLKPKQQPTFQKIIQAVREQTKEWNDPKYIPHATTWINQKRWNDVITAGKMKRGVSKVSVGTGVEKWKRTAKSDRIHKD